EFKGKDIEALLLSLLNLLLDVQSVVDNNSMLSCISSSIYLSSLKCVPVFKDPFGGMNNMEKVLSSITLNANDRWPKGRDRVMTLGKSNDHLKEGLSVHDLINSERKLREERNVKMLCTAWQFIHHHHTLRSPSKPGRAKYCTISGAIRGSELSAAVAGFSGLGVGDTSFYVAVAGAKD
ncbi:hypothetical protein Tco_0681335, partial [Tanacetum coccineum]